MKWLVYDARPGDSFFFHCTFASARIAPSTHDPLPDSGHGGQTKDLDGDEEDGYDEGYKFMIILWMGN